MRTHTVRDFKWILILFIAVMWPNRGFSTVRGQNNGDHDGLFSSSGEKSKSRLELPMKTAAPEAPNVPPGNLLVDARTEAADEKDFKDIKSTFQDSAPLHAALRKQISDGAKITLSECWKSTTDVNKGDTTYEKLPSGIILYTGNVTADGRDKGKLIIDYVANQDLVRDNMKGTKKEKEELDKKTLDRIAKGPLGPIVLDDSGKHLSFRGSWGFGAGVNRTSTDTEIEFRGDKDKEVVRIEADTTSQSGTLGGPITKSRRRVVYYCK